MSIPLIFVCGGTNFNRRLDGYEDMRLYCPRCHNISVIAMKKREFFTFCFVPLIPTNWGEFLNCTICPYEQKTSTAQLDSLRVQNQNQQQSQMSQNYQQQQTRPMPVGRGPGAHDHAYYAQQPSEHQQGGK